MKRFEKPFGASAFVDFSAYRSIGNKLTILMLTCLCLVHHANMMS